MFEIGSYVIYRSEGVCVISDVREESFSTLGGASRFYILNPINDLNSVVYVPCDNENLVGMMRALLSPAEIDALAEEIKNERMELPTDIRMRNAKYKEIFAEGDRRSLMILVNTVGELIEKLENEGKKVGSTDRNAFSRALKYLYEEFSATADISGIDELVDIIKTERSCRAKATAL